MDEKELRVAALRQAADDEKNVAGTSADIVYGGPPAADKVVSRAETYLAFLNGGGSITPAT